MSKYSRHIVSENFKILRKLKFGSKRFPKELVNKINQSTIQRLENSETDFGVNLLDDVAGYFNIETYKLLIDSSNSNKLNSKEEEIKYLLERINEDGLNFLLTTAKAIALQYPKELKNRDKEKLG